MSEVFFTSDLHIGHKKVAGIRWAQRFPILTATYPIPPNVVEWHDLALAKEWDATVGEDDVVWVLGDISSGTKQAQLDALWWLRKRPGTKHLIAGNHDGVHPLHRDSHKWLPIYLDHIVGAFASVQMAAKRRIPLPEGHVSALLSHFPYEADRGDVTRYPEWRLRDRGYYLMHGHTHSQERCCGKEIHVGVDAWDFRPVSLGEIASYVCEQELRPPKPYEDVPLPFDLEGK